jgi:hypothetical protein
MKRVTVLLVGAALVLMTGCRHVESSEIVKTFRDAGGGDVDKSSPGSIAQFLAKRDDVRARITPLCKEKQTQEPADWSSTNEGKVCDANQKANFFGKSKIKSDGVAF